MRLLAIQELPQSKRVKLVFDDDTVLKTQPYLLADFGLYSGMELTEEDLSGAAGCCRKSVCQRRGPCALSQRQACLKRSCRSALSGRVRKQPTRRKPSAGSRSCICSMTARQHGSSLQALRQRATGKAASKIFYSKRASRRNSGRRRLRSCRNGRRH